MKRLTCLVLAALATGTFAAGAAAGPAWAEAFPVAADAPARVHLQARYRGRDGAWHRLALWRDGEAFLHRRTDDRLDLFVSADANAAGHDRYRVLDARSRALIEVDRTNLLRIGVFADRASLAHVIAPSAAGDALEAIAPPVSDAPMACGWVRLRRAGAAPVDVCWSARWAAPVRIRRAGAAGDDPTATQFELLAAEAADARDDGFVLPHADADVGLIDANADIAPDAD